MLVAEVLLIVLVVEVEVVEVAVTVDSSREEGVLDVEEDDDDLTAACLFEKKELSTVIVRFFMPNLSLSLSLSLFSLSLSSLSVSLSLSLSLSLYTIPFPSPSLFFFFGWRRWGHSWGHENGQGAMTPMPPPPGYATGVRACRGCWPVEDGDDAGLV